MLELVEDDDLVDAVQSLAGGDLLEPRHDLFGPLGQALLVADREAERLVLGDLRRAEVRGHDHDRVAEVNPPLGVRELPVLEDLEQDVEHVRVGLLDLVEEDD